MKKIIFLILSVLLIYNISGAQTTEYKISNRIHLDGDAGWDYLSVDDAANRLFISHGNMVQVLDLNSGTLSGTIKDTKGVHGIAIAPDLNKGFISCGRDTAVAVFNLKTLELITKVKVTGINPDAILYDSFSKKVFAFNGRTSNATVMDANTNEIISTIPLDGKPEFSATDEKGRVYVNIEDKNKISVINSSSLQVEQGWSIDPGDEPSGLAIDNENHILFSVCGNKLMVIVDAQTGTVITTVPIGDRVDGAGFDTGTKRAFSSNGEGTMTVVQEDSPEKFTVLENFATQKGARTIAVNSKTHHIYMPTAEYEPAPEPTTENPNPRPKIKPGTFIILDIEQIVKN